MSGLSLSQIRSYIDRLRDLDDEMSRHCRVAEIRLKGADADRAGGVEEACKSLEKCQETVREARQALLEYDGFLHAQRESLRGALDHPRLGGKAATFFGQVGERLGPVLDQHVSTLVEEGVECLRGLGAALRALEEGADDEAEAASAKDSLKAIKKALSVSEKAIEKAMKMTADATGEAHVASHGYQLTAKGLPPEFLENAQKKKDEAAAKKDDEDEKKSASHGYSLTAKVPDFIQEKIDERENGKKKDDDDDDEKKKGAKKATIGYVLTADSRTPGNESKGPVEEGEEDEGWVPGHRTDGEKKATAGYQLTA